MTIVSGTTLAIAAGAQRTAGVAGRYASAYSSSYNGEILQHEGPPRTAEVAAVPGVEAIEAVTFLFAGLQRPDGSDIDSIVFAGSLGALGHLVAGRVADPGAADEMVVSSSFLTASDAALGDQFEFFAFTAEHPALYRVVREAEYVSPGAMRRHYERIVEGYRDGLTRARAAGEIGDVDPEVAAWALMGVGEMIGMRYVLWPTGDDGAFGSGATPVPDDVFDEMVAFVQRALGTAAPTTATATSHDPTTQHSTTERATAHVKEDS